MGQPPEDSRTAVLVEPGGRTLRAVRTLHLILYVIAAVLFAIAAFAPASLAKVNLVAAGLLVWICVPLSALINDIAD